MNTNQAYTLATNDSELKEYNGTKVIITNVLTKDNCNFDIECLPMYEINLTHNGKAVNVWEDELKTLKD